MRDVTLTWQFPTQRVSGGALDPNDIQGVELGIRAQGIPDYTLLAQVDAPATEFQQSELDFGTYGFSCVVVLKNGQRSAAAEIVVDVADNSPPRPVSAFAAVVE